MFTLQFLASVPVVSMFSSHVFQANVPFAYAGPGTDVQFISYFFSLLGMVGVAFSAAIMWPIYTFLRWLRGGKGKSSPTVTAVVSTPAGPATEGITHS
jgi:hypothetical protein